MPHFWKISKEFEFDFGHRVWTQELDSKFSLDNQCKCRFFHGHRGKVIVNLTGDELASNGMLTDFKHLNVFKALINEHFDHKFLLDTNDPILPHVFSKDELDSLHYREVNEGFSYFYLRVPDDISSVEKEKREGFVFLDFVPTAENLSQYFAEGLRKLLAPLPGVTVSSVTFYETPKAKSEYCVDAETDD